MPRGTSPRSASSFAALALAAGAVSAQPIPLEPSTIEAYRTAIEPTVAEASFLAIDWYAELRPALQAAHESRKPLLIYVMNGHPLGCT